jgi:hypothetical protein
MGLMTMPHQYAGASSTTKPSIYRTAFASVVFAIAACASLQPSSAYFMEEKRFGPYCNARTHACQVRASLAGMITPQDATTLSQAIAQIHRQAADANWDIDPIYLSLDTPGGDVSAAMTIGRLLRQEQAHVRIDSDAECLSACVLVLAGAVGRDIRGKVGIHRPYFNTSAAPSSAEKIREAYQDMLQKMRSYLREMNVSEQLADAMLRIEPEGIRVLNATALTNYGLTPKDPVAAEMNEIRTAQRLGLTRTEYMRRKALASTICDNSATVCYRRVLESGKEDPGVPPDQIDFSQFGRAVQPQQ